MATVQHANFIEYGRKGPRRSHSDPDPYAEELFGSNSHMSDLSKRRGKIISAPEFNRIQGSLNAKETSAKNRQKKEQENERLRDLSRKQVNSWGNTLAGQRKAKLEAKKLREEREEEIRKTEDIDEAIFKAAERKKAIAHAKTLTFAQTDRVKGFHGALILTEVLKEREAQLQLKDERLRLRAARENRLHLESLQELRRSELEEERAAKERSQKRKDVQKYQLAQVKLRQEERAEMLEEQRLEGEETKLITEEHNTVKKLKQQRNEEKKNYMKKCFFDHLKGKEVFKARARLQEKEEETEIKIFNVHKERMKKIRDKKQKEKIYALTTVQEGLLAKLEGEHLITVADEEQALVKAAEERLAKEDEVNRKKHERAEVRIAEMKNVLHVQKTEKEKQRLELLRQEWEEKQDDWRCDVQHREAERKKTNRRRNTNVEFQDHHLQQINRRVARSREEHELDVACDQTINKLNLLEEEQFQTYAKEVIADAISKDRNPYPLRKAAETGAGGGRGPKFSGIGGLKPSYMACDNSGVQMPNYSQRHSTLELKKKLNPAGQKGRERLGLIWSKK